MTPRHGLALVTGPTAEPVPLALAKAHLRLDANEDDGLLAGYLLAARSYVERITARALMPQTWRMTLDAWPGDAFELPLAPVQSITSVTYLDGAGATQTVASSTYVLDAAQAPARLVLAPSGRWPVDGGRAGNIAVTFVAGYADLGAVPEPLRHAILLLAAHWYEHREAVVAGQEPSTVPLAFDALVSAYRVHWL